MASKIINKALGFSLPREGVARDAKMLIKPSENHYFERPNGRDFGGHGDPKNCFAALVFKTISFSKAAQMKAENCF